MRNRKLKSCSDVLFGWGARIPIGLGISLGSEASNEGIAQIVKTFIHAKMIDGMRFRISSVFNKLSLPFRRCRY
jgi:hypothetical protein